MIGLPLTLVEHDNVGYAVFLLSGFVCFCFVLFFLVEGRGHYAWGGVNPSQNAADGRIEFVFFSSNLGHVRAKKHPTRWENVVLHSYMYMPLPLPPLPTVQSNNALS